MHSIGVITLALFSLLVVGQFAPLWASPQTPVASANQSYRYEYTGDIPSVPTIAAYVVMDEATGEVLLEHNPDSLLPLASVAKLVVAGVAYRAPLPLLAATTTITAGDVATPEAFGKLEAGQVYTLRELLFPYLLESSNDAGAAIERTWGSVLGYEIDELLVSTDTVGQIIFGDYAGLSPATAGSARAVATIARALAQSVPHVFDITQLPRYVGQGATLVNNSPVYTNPTYRGGKHGYTEAAGKTLLARAATPFADGERILVYVILGGADQSTDLEALSSLVSKHIIRVPQPMPASAILSASSNQ